MNWEKFFDNVPREEENHKQVLLVNEEEEDRCCPGGTECPAGCCPFGQGWFCCADNMYCAPTEAECP